ncbi:acyltransferase family protein [Enterococcus dongliensis]|uniref:acyltransferase family protein n=1 Tax=Enterococcus dongliensis TaxID=2559925 RepID=UPI0028931447|nr:acyltransferase family protein [Enterococcus dongliensis]
MFVMMHHLSQVLKEYPDSFLSSKLIIVGRLAVGLFFFVSGYGLIKQYKNKGEVYLRTFFKKKIMSVILPFILAMIIYYIYDNFTGEMRIEVALSSLLNGSPIVSNGWFVIMIIYLYISFYISAYLTKRNTLILVLLLLLSSFLVIYLADYLDYGEWWTNAVFCFPLGIIWSSQERRVTNFLFKNYRISGITLAVLFSCFFYLDEIFNRPVFRMVSVIFFVSFIVITSYKFTFHNPIFYLIKSFSFELYLYQGLFIRLCHSDTFM